MQRTAQHVAAKRRPQDGKLVHVESSGLKAAATWHRIQILQDCRECCGGMGFLSANKIGPMLGAKWATAYDCMHGARLVRVPKRLHHIATLRLLASLIQSMRTTVAIMRCWSARGMEYWSARGMRQNS
jgi:hypothetical protein